MTAATLEREASSADYAELFKAYFSFVARLVPPEDVELIRHDGADFLIRVPADKVEPLTEQFAELAYQLRGRFGIAISTIVIPKV